MQQRLLTRRSRRASQARRQTSFSRPGFSGTRGPAGGSGHAAAGAPAAPAVPVRVRGLRATRRRRCSLGRPRGPGEAAGRGRPVHGPAERGRAGRGVPGARRRQSVSGRPALVGRAGRGAFARRSPDLSSPGEWGGGAGRPARPGHSPGWRPAGGSKVRQPSREGRAGDAAARQVGGGDSQPPTLGPSSGAPGRILRSHPGQGGGGGAQAWSPRDLSLGVWTESSSLSLT